MATNSQVFDWAAAVANRKMVFGNSTSSQSAPNQSKEVAKKPPSAQGVRNKAATQGSSRARQTA
jgi:hypothetical protein